MHTVPAGTIWNYGEDRLGWLRDRRTGLGGSDIAAVLGLESFTSALEVYYSKVDEDAPELEPSEAMDIGLDIEDWIIQRWISQQAKATGSTMRVWADLVTIRSNDHPFLLHSPDGLVMSGNDIISGLEVKNVRSDAGWDPLPEGYYAQVQHGLLCSGLPYWDVVALVGGQRLIHRQIEPDQEFMGRIALEGERFWVDHIRIKVPPAADGSASASRAIRSHWGASQDSSVEIPADLWERYLDAKQRVTSGSVDLNIIEQEIQLLMGDHERAEVNGERVATWKMGTRTTIDSKRMKLEAPDVYKKFAKTTTTRPFRPYL
jgi:putative phage-type endonuclease